MPNHYDDYSVKELFEAWLSVDDETYPDRAVELYTRLKAAGHAAYEKEPPPGNVWDEMIDFVLPKLIGEPITTDMALQNDLAREKAQRVLALIHARQQHTIA